MKIQNWDLVYSPADTLGMEGNVIERRTSSAALWSDARQQTAPTSSSSQSLTTTPVNVPAYSNIFVTPPTELEQRKQLTKAKEAENPDIPASKLSQIKDKHDGEIQNFFSVLKLAAPLHLPFDFRTVFFNGSEM